MHGATHITIIIERSKNNLEAMPKLDSLQKTASNVTHYTKVLLSGTGSLSGGDRSWFKRSTREERPVTTVIMSTVVTVFILNIWVFFPR
jgi:hypothetical protein